MRLEATAAQILAPPSSAITGWTVITDHVPRLQTGNAYSIVPQDGNISLDLQGYTDSAPFGGVQQVLTTSAGQLYDLSFWIGVQNSLCHRSRARILNRGRRLSITTVYEYFDRCWQPMAAVPSELFCDRHEHDDFVVRRKLCRQLAPVGFDNVAVNAVPEPASMFLSAVSLRSASQF